MEKVNKLPGDVCIPRRVEDRPAGVTYPGDKIYVKTRYFYGENGEQLAEPGDKVDMDAYIQASKASTDIVSIIARAQAGDETVLNVHQNGLTGDLTKLPTNVNDVVALNKLSDKALNNFNALPQEVRDLFDNDATKFFNAVLENKANEVIDSYLKNKKEIVETPKVEKEGE